MYRPTLAALALCAVLPAPARAATAGDYVPDTPPAFDGVRLTEHLGATVPLDLPFRDQDGHDVSLRDYFGDERPAILTFNYSDCPMLCSLQLNGLAQALTRLDLVPGQQFRIVTIDLEPRESPQRAAATRAKYLALLPANRRETARPGWTFLVARTPGDDTQIRAVAAAAGFGYRYVAERAEYAHPAALILLSSRGMITRYIGGVDYPTDVLHDSIMRAGLAETATDAGFVLTCFHYVASGTPRTAFTVMRIVAGSFLGLGLVAIVVLRRRRNAGRVR